MLLEFLNSVKALKNLLHFQKMLDQTRSYQRNMTLSTQGWFKMSGSKLIHEESVEWRFIWENRLLHRQVMTVLGKSSTWRLRKTLWLARDTKIGLLVLTFILLGLILLLVVVTDHWSFGTLSHLELLTHSKISPLDLYGRLNSMIRVTLCLPVPPMVQ